MARLTVTQHRATARRGNRAASRARVAGRERRHNRGSDATPAAQAWAMAQLDPWYAEDDPTAPDAYYAELASDVPPDVQAYSTVADAIRYPTSRKTAQPRKPRATSVAAARVAQTRTPASLDPCPRCGRTDWQTANGRTWHLDNNPACATFPRKPEHAYIGG